jgi:hypothetical protein
MDFAKYGFRSFLIPGSASGGTLQELASTGPGDEGIVLNDDFTAGEYGSDVSYYLESFEHRIVHAHVMGCGTNGKDCVRVPDDDIRVAARRDFALFRVHAEELGWGCRD